MLYRIETMPGLGWWVSGSGSLQLYPLVIPNTILDSLVSLVINHACSWNIATCSFCLIQLYCHALWNKKILCHSDGDPKTTSILLWNVNKQPLRVDDFRLQSLEGSLSLNTFSSFPQGYWNVGCTRKNLNPNGRLPIFSGIGTCGCEWTAIKKVVNASSPIFPGRITLAPRVSTWMRFSKNHISRNIHWIRSRMLSSTSNRWKKIIMNKKLSELWGEYVKKENWLNFNVWPV